MSQDMRQNAHTLPLHALIPLPSSAYARETVTNKDKEQALQFLPPFLLLAPSNFYSLHQKWSAELS